MAKVWLITGPRRFRPGVGAGRARARRQRGGDGNATRHARGARRGIRGARCSRLELDVTDKAAIDRSVAAAHERFGRLDVVVNNAGYGQFGAIEEVTEEEARRQIETNLFGLLAGG